MAVDTAIINPEILTSALEQIEPTKDLFFLNKLTPKKKFESKPAFSRIDYGADVAANVGAMQVHYGDLAQVAIKVGKWLYINEALSILGNQAIELREALGQRNVDMISAVLRPHLEELRRRADRRVETTILQAVTGSIQYPGGDTLDTEIPSANKITASTAWSDTSADVLTDIGNAKEKVKYATPSILYVPRKVYEALAKNNNILKYIQASPTLAERAITTGKLPPIHGLEIVIHENAQVTFPTYDDGGTDKYYAIVIPAIDNEWLELQHGPNPNADSKHRPGWFANIKLVGELLTHYGMIVNLAYFPALRNPYAVALIKTGIAA